MGPSIDRAFDPTAWDRRRPLAVRIRTVIVKFLFWGAILLPAVYVPLFVFDPDTVTRTTALGLLALHAGCLLASHSYTPE